MLLLSSIAAVSSAWSPFEGHLLYYLRAGAADLELLKW